MKKFSFKIILTLVLIVTTVLSVSACGAKPATDNSEKTTAALTAESFKVSDKDVHTSSNLQISGGKAYYLDFNKRSELFKADIDDIAKSKVIAKSDKDDISGIVVSGKTVYYSTTSEIFKTDTEGKNPVKLCDNFKDEKFLLVKNRIYYVSDSREIRYVTTDGKNSKVVYKDEKYANVNLSLALTDVFDNHLYFAVNGGLGKVGFDGDGGTIFYKNKDIVANDSDCILDCGYIYYTVTETDKNNDEYNYYLCQVKVDGTDDKKYSNTQNISDFAIINDELFFVRKRILYGMKQDGSSETRITDLYSQQCSLEFVYDENMYFSECDGDKFELWSINRNGENKNVLITLENIDSAVEVSMQYGYVFINTDNNNRLIKL